MPLMRGTGAISAYPLLNTRFQPRRNVSFKLTLNFNTTKLVLKNTDPKPKIMALVDYSDSDPDASDADAETKPTPAQKPTTSKSSFQKLTDSSTGKIRVSLPTPVAQEDREERPAKRTKIGSGAFCGFNSLLPPPKKTGLAAALPAPKGLGRGASSSSTSASAAVRKPLSLKTGAAPAFSRSTRGYNEDGNYDDMGTPTGGSGGGMSLPTPKAASQPVAQGKPAAEVKMVGLGKPMQFKPLSVGRKVVKKRKKTVDELRPAEVERSKVQQSNGAQEQAVPERPKPKTSLFSVRGDEEEDAAVPTKANGAYQPMIYGAQTVKEEYRIEDPPYASSHDPSYSPPPYQQQQQQHSQPSSNNTNSLDSIAADLNLTAAERRQLFGRNHNQNLSAQKVINFNMDMEYQHNEEVRAGGETVTHNPVRAIAPGKHSLKQLVSQVQNQKDALEESFQKGYANRDSARGRYGW